MTIQITSDAQPAGLPDGLPLPRRYWATLAIALAAVLTVLNFSIINIALPAIADNLRISPASSVWIVNAYQLTVTVLLLPAASLGEIVGYRRVYVAGILVFALASVVCAVADSLATLITARVAQGIGGAGIMSIQSAVIRFIYPRLQLGHGIGINALVVAAAAASGPTVGAAILSVADWPWLFAINVPIGALALLIAIRTLPSSPLAPHRFDIVSAILNVLTFGLLIIGIDGLGHGQRSGVTLIELAGATGFGYLLVRRQLSLPSPLLPVDLLRIPIFALSIGTSTCAFIAQMLAFVSLPFYLHDLGKSAVEIGLLMTPWPLAIVVIAPIAGRLSDHYPAGLLGGIGLATFMLGLILLAILPAQPSVLDIAWRMTFCGLGYGLFQSPNNRTIMSAAPKHRSGGASGMLGTARLLGLTLGAALASLTFSLLPGHSTSAALLSGAGFALLAAILSSLRMAAKPRP